MTSSADKIVAIAEREFTAHGVRTTTKRVNIFAILLSSKTAVSAYDLVDSYEQVFKAPVPVVTVYRVLEFLQTKHLVHKLETANKFIACAHIDCNHTHPASQFLICKQCLKVKELSISQSKFEELQQTITLAGFHLDEPQLEINCVCEACYAESQ